MSGSDALLQAMVSIAAAHLANPNTRIETAELKGFLRTLHTDISEIATGAAPAPALQAPAGLGLDTPFLPAPSTLAGPAPSVPALPVAAPVAGIGSGGMTEQARASLDGSVAFLGLPYGAKGVPKVWKGVPRDSKAKFLRLIEEHNIPIGQDGYPIPRKQLDRLISVSGMQVADPITGQYHTMLKRHLRLVHDLDHVELLAMFNLTEEQLPCTGPAYSAAKAEQARRTGLGKRPPASAEPQGESEAAPARRRKVRSVA